MIRRMPVFEKLKKASVKRVKKTIQYDRSVHEHQIKSASVNAVELNFAG